MGWADYAILKLSKSQTAFVIPHGDSMLPRVRSGQRVVVNPLKDGQPEVDDVVLVRVRGSVKLHLVTAIDGARYQISNNHGHVNGWVGLGAIYGKADV